MRDLEIWVSGRARSLKMPPFDRPCNLLLVCHCKYSSILYTVFELFDVE